MAGIADAVAEIKTAFRESEQKLVDLIKKQENEIKNLGGTTSETSEKIKKAEETLSRLGADLVEVQQKFSEQTGRIDEIEKMLKRPGFDRGGEAHKTHGQQFVESDAYKEFVSKGFSGKSDVVHVKSFFRKADPPAETLTGGSLGSLPGYLYTPERLADIIVQPDRMQRVRDLMPVMTTTQGAIEFVRETGYTNNAAGVAEKEAKPKSKLEFDIASTSVKTIAHWLPVTRQILSDATQLRGYIDARLIVGLKLEEDEQILYGDGTSANLQGILTDDEIQTFTPAEAKPDDTKIDMIRRAMTKARVAEYPVTGIILHPSDWEDIELMKDSDKRYIWVTVPDGGEQRLWRVPVVDTTAINEGDFLTGAFSLGAAIWDREEATIRASDSHEDFFIRNLLAILAEERLALTIYRPEAFVYGQFEQVS